jgi:dephospho-CoA kinase
VKRVIVGVTGVFGSGKTTVSKMFKEFGAKEIIDFDLLAREIVQPKGEVWMKIVGSFGEGILNSDFTINRGKLASLIFNNTQARKRLEEITHPPIIQLAKERLGEEGVIIMDVPLLIETSLHQMVDRVVLVIADEKTIIDRLRDDFGVDEIRRRISAQLPPSIKREYAHYVIDNNGTKLETKRQVECVWRELKNLEEEIK